MTVSCATGCPDHRRPDWPERLADVLALWQDRPFRWGETDCVHFAHAVLCAVSGREWGSVSVPAAASLRAARRALLRMEASGSLEKAVSALLGPPSLPATARRGDLMAIACDGPFRVALGVCVGSRALAPGLCGLVATPLDQTVCCWRI